MPKLIIQPNQQLPALLNLLEEPLKQKIMKKLSFKLKDQPFKIKGTIN